MTEDSKVIEALKKMLKARGFTYATLADGISMSEVSVKRMLSGSVPITLDRLATICEFLGINFMTLVQIGSESNVHEQSKKLTWEQEESLASDIKLYICFNSLARGMSANMITEKFKLTKQDVSRALITLDKIKIIELYPNDKVKLLVYRYPEWIENGPLSTLYENQLKKEFLNATFKADGEAFQFISRNLSARSRKLISKKLDNLVSEVRELASVDEALEDKGRAQTTYLFAMRPWIPSSVAPYIRLKS